MAGVGRDLSGSSVLVPLTLSASPGLELAGDGGGSLPGCLLLLRIRCCGTFSWDEATRSAPGNMAKSCIQGPSFGLDMSTVAAAPLQGRKLFSSICTQQVWLTLYLPSRQGFLGQSLLDQSQR